MPDLCESNAAVAADLGRHDVALAWRAVKTLYGSAQAGGMADFLGLASLDAVVRVDADRSRLYPFFILGPVALLYLLNA